MSYTVQPLSRDLGFGAIVSGMTLAELEASETRRQLSQLFVRDGLILFNDTEVTNDLHVELSKIAGPLTRHSLKEYEVEGHPELIRIEYRKGQDSLFSVDGQRLGGFIPWHYDGVFTAKVNRGGVLRLEHGPATSGATGFMDLIGTYERLPSALQERIEHLEVVYSMDFDFRFPFIPNQTIEVIDEGLIYRKARKKFDNGDFPPTVHPLVMRQKETGRKVLRLSPYMAVSVLGMDEQASHDLLLELAAYATDERYAYFHQWSGPDELVLWDNWRMLHKACGVPEDDERAVVRTTIGGEYTAGRVLDAAQA